jgi:DNA-binding IclR family transcriptional regulator
VLAGNSPQDAAIRNQLGELRTSGQIVDRGAIEADVVSIARIVRGNNNQVVGAIEVLIPQYRARIESDLHKIEESADSLSTALGATRGKLAVTMEKEVAQPTMGLAPAASAAAQPARFK